MMDTTRQPTVSTVSQASSLQWWPHDGHNRTTNGQRCKSSIYPPMMTSWWTQQGNQWSALQVKYLATNDDLMMDTTRQPMVSTVSQVSSHQWWPCCLESRMVPTPCWTQQNNQSTCLCSCLFVSASLSTWLCEWRIISLSSNRRSYGNIHIMLLLLSK